jgi:RNA polymerase sigma-70 factor (ECF subfamily)
MHTLILSPANLHEEYEWVLEAQSNPKKFDPIYRKYYTKIFTYIDRRIQNKDLASDITSQVFIQAIQRIHSYEDKGYSFGSWLFRIAHNTVCQEFRDLKRSKVVDLEINQLFLVDGLDESADKEERLQTLALALKKMKRKHLEIIELRYFENLAFREIGLQLGISENTAKVRCFRALDKLKEIYKMI